MADKDKKRPRGRPSRPMPERIDASPEDIAEVVLKMPPKQDWRYLKAQDSTSSD